VSDADELVPYAVSTYRYLRLSIVVMVLALFVSVIIERLHVDCWQGSISAYYYTPAHAIFVGALVAIGVSLIAIKGSTDLEDVLLNVAGLLAPIVAFVPTTPPSGGCPSTALISGDIKAYVDNNVLAYAIGGAVAIAAAYVIARLTGKSASVSINQTSIIGFVIVVVLVVAGLIWYFGFRDSFLAHAHTVSAAAMFLLIAIVIIINARSAAPVYRTIYALTIAAMALAAVAVGIAKLADHDWQHQTLWIETLVLIPFAVYWLAQTFEHWEGGVPTGDERAQRAEESGIKRR
jgi:hypothetical protein